MKKNLCFFVVSILLSMNSNAQDIATDSVAILDSIRNAGTRVQIRYVPKEKPKRRILNVIKLEASCLELLQR